MESLHHEHGAATPFDSGGIAKDKVQRLEPAESALEFMLRHEMPVPEHRRYLSLCLNSVFNDVLDYLRFSKDERIGPLGLRKGDCRRWTHEVRIPRAVEVKNFGLQAVFLSTAAIGENAPIDKYLEWCRAQNKDVVQYPGSTDGEDFETMRDRCFEYIKAKFCRELY